MWRGWGGPGRGGCTYLTVDPAAEVPVSHVMSTCEARRRVRSARAQAVPRANAFLSGLPYPARSGWQIRCIFGSKINQRGAGATRAGQRTAAAAWIPSAKTATAARYRAIAGNTLTLTPASNPAQLCSVQLAATELVLCWHSLV